MLLAIDTATRYMGLALHDGESLIGEQAWHTGNKHNEWLAPAIRDLLRVCGVKMTDLSAVAVAKGPGSYTGLRIGVALAKGIATTAQLPLIGISTLDALVAGQSQSTTHKTLVAIVPAGRGRIIAGQYTWQAQRWQNQDEPTITRWQDLLAMLANPCAFTGEIDSKGRDALQATAHTLIEPAARLRRAGYLAEAAWQRFRAGERADFLPAKLLPVYLKSD